MSQLFCSHGEQFAHTSVSSPNKTYGSANGVVVGCLVCCHFLTWTEQTFVHGSPGIGPHSNSVGHVADVKYHGSPWLITFFFPTQPSSHSKKKWKILFCVELKLPAILNLTMALGEASPGLNRSHTTVFCGVHQILPH